MYGYKYEIKMMKQWIQQQRMYYSSKKDNMRETGERRRNVMYPDASIRQYLNMKRTTKDKTCLIIFLLYSLAMTIMMGIGFFYGNYDSMGTFVAGQNVVPDEGPQQCTNTTAFVDSTFSTCLSECSTEFVYLQRVCADESYNPEFSEEVSGLISMYDIWYTLPMITYITICLLVVTGILFVIIIYVPKIIYLYITLLFLMLLSFAFYLLKTVEIRIATNITDTSSIFYTNETSMGYLSFLLLAIYLLIFPFILFSPKKIQMATLIIGGLKDYFNSMITMNLFTFLVVIVGWGCLLIEIFLLMNFYSAGTISTQPTSSMFYTYQTMYLYHPASLVFHFIGVYWLFGTLISWHKYFTSSAVCLWYFQESERLQPVKRGLKRSLYHVGSAAVDAFLMPIQWVLLMCYSISKVSEEEVREQEENGGGCTNCLFGIRECINQRYRQINRGGPSSAGLTNFPYFESCEISATVFAQNNYRFFNIGGTITIFLTLFVCIFWVMITYFIIYYQVYNQTFPPPISSMILPILCVFFLGLVVGSLYSNIFTAAIDCLLFCYLMEKKNMIEGEEQEPRPQDDLKIKQILDKCFYRTEEEKKGQNVYVYEEVNENTLELTYVSKRQ